MSEVPYLGEILSLAAAVVWAGAVILFKKSGETVHPIGLNLFKGLLGITLFIPTDLLLREDIFHESSSRNYLLLLASGALGIAVCDTLFLRSLNILGASLSAIVDCLYAPFVTILSVLFLKETLTGWQVGGIALIALAIVAATYEPRRMPTSLPRKDLIFGLSLGAVAMLSMAISIIMVKEIMEKEPLIWTTQVRLVGGVALLIPMLLLHPQRRAIVHATLWGSGRIYTVLGSFLGAYLAMMCWVGGLKYTQASVAANLNQMSNLFVFIFGALFLAEAVNRRRVLGIILGIGGVFLVTFG